MAWGIYHGRKKAYKSDFDNLKEAKSMINNINKIGVNLPFVVKRVKRRKK